MPNWENYYFSYDPATISSTCTSDSIPYVEFEKEYEEEMERLRKERKCQKQEEEDRRKYPLFFLKEGIV